MAMETAMAERPAGPIVQHPHPEGHCCVCGDKLNRAQGPTCPAQRNRGACAHAYRAVQLARLLAERPGLRRKEVAEALAFSERQAQQVLNWLREANPEVTIVVRGRFARQQGYRFVPDVVQRVTVDGREVRVTGLALGDLRP